MALALVFGTLLAIMPGIMNSCLHLPLQKFSQPCSIHNLAIVSTTAGKEIVCGESIPYTLLVTQPDVYLAELDKDKNESDFVLLAYDITMGKLQWALSNVTPRDKNIISRTDANTAVLKPYQPLTLDPQNKQHDLVFAIFQRKPDIVPSVAVTVNLSNSASFNLYEWSSEQLRLGIKLCGPVAAAQFTVNTDADATQWPAQARSRSPPQLQLNADSTTTHRPSRSARSASYSFPAREEPQPPKATDAKTLADAGKASITADKKAAAAAAESSSKPDDKSQPARASPTPDAKAKAGPSQQPEAAKRASSEERSAAKTDEAESSGDNKGSTKADPATSGTNESPERPAPSAIKESSRPSDASGAKEQPKESKETEESNGATKNSSETSSSGVTSKSNSAVLAFLIVLATLGTLCYPWGGPISIPIPGTW